MITRAGPGTAGGGYAVRQTTGGRTAGRRTFRMAAYATTAQFAVIGIAAVGLSLVTDGLPVERGDWLYSIVWITMLSAVFGLVQAALFAAPAALIGGALARRLPGARFLWHLAPVPVLPLVPAAIAYSYDGAAWQWWAWLTLLGCVPALAAAADATARRPLRGGRPRAGNGQARTRPQSRVRA